MRKSRSAHIKCDCGEKTHKCVHLRPVVEGHKDNCCCNHGGRCTCCHKKEPTLDTVPESDSDGSGGSLNKSAKLNSRVRRRANTTNSDLLAFDANGHHKPTYKHTKASQKCGPYQLSRVNSVHSASSLGDCSVDSMLGCGKSASSSVSDDSLPQPQRSKSEATSPSMTGSSSFAHLNGQLPPLDLSSIKYPAYIANSADFFGNLSDHEQPIFSAGLSADPVDWSGYEGLEQSTDFAPSSYSQPQSYGGFDFHGSEPIPTLTTTTSTSGEVSEAEDFFSNPLEDFDTYRGSAHSGGYGIGHAHSNMLANPDLTNIDFEEYNFMKKTSAKFLAATSSLVGEDPTLLAGASAFGGFSLDDDPTFWPGISDFSGLPSLTDSPTETNMPTFWDGQ